MPSKLTDEMQGYGIHPGDFQAAAVALIYFRGLPMTSEAMREKLGRAIGALQAMEEDLENSQ